VSDGTLATGVQSFNIAVGAVSDMAAVIVNTGASAQEGGEVGINAMRLLSTNHDHMEIRHTPGQLERMCSNSSSIAGLGWDAQD